MVFPIVRRRSSSCSHVGYMRGTAKICIHSEEDLLEAWSKIEKESCMLWCDGTAEVVKSSSRTTK